MEFLQKAWDWLPGGETAGKIVFISAILGIIAFVTFLNLRRQKLRLDQPEKRAAEDSERLKRIEDILIGRARAQSAFLPGSDQPGAKQAEAIIEQDIGAAISTLAKAGKIEAAEAAERGDTKAADDALAAKIAKLERARLGAAKEEAALYRQRGGLAYTDDAQAALRFYARAAELDPEDIEGLFSLAQLQIRAGYPQASKQNLGLIALGNRIEDGRRRHFARFLQGDVEAALADRDAVSGVYERTQTLVHDLMQRDLSVSYDRAGDLSGAREDRDGALKTYSDGLEIAKKLAARDPDNAELQRDLSVSYNLIGDISASRGDRDGALNAYQDGLDIAKALSARDPDNTEWQRDLSVSYIKIGDINAARGDRDGALKAYQDGLDIAKALAARDPNNVVWQRDLAIRSARANECLGDMSESDGNTAEAVAAFEGALAIYIALIARFDDHEARANSVVLLWRLAGLKGKDGNADLQRARDILIELRDAGRLDSMRIGWIPEIEAEIAALQEAGAPAAERASSLRGSR
jgi:tetratricopeptide (TPR) repeat protein